MKQLTYILFFALLSSCKQYDYSKSYIKEDIAYLADDLLKGRETGTEGELKAAAFLAKRFEEIGLEPKGTEGFFQKFTFKPSKDPHKEVEFTEINDDGSVTGTNVVGFINNNAKTSIVIGAHYDHLGFGGQGSLHRGEKAIHNGADDNASGVAVMMDLARKLVDKAPNNNYVFIAFSGEEMGLLGSNYFTKNATLDITSVNYMINMDMIGRLKDDRSLAVHGVGTSPLFSQTIMANNSDFKIIKTESGVGPSDHTSFYLNDIPVLHFFTGQHEDYHKPSDDFEKLNYEGMQAISEYIFNIISDLDDNGKMAFRKTKNESEEVPRFKVALGVVPDYMFDGKGMRIDGMREDTPAQEAGLRKGDVVIKLGDSIVTDMMSYMRALSSFKKGNKTQVVVDRNGEEIKADVTF